MDLNKPLDAMTPGDRRDVEEHLTQAKQFGPPRKVWVEDGHVFIEGHDREIISMTPATAIDMGRKLSEAGADAVINEIVDKGSETARKLAAD